MAPFFVHAEQPQKSDAIIWGSPILYGQYRSSNESVYGMRQGSGTLRKPGKIKLPPHLLSPVDLVEIS